METKTVISVDGRIVVITRGGIEIEYDEVDGYIVATYPYRGPRFYLPVRATKLEVEAIPE